jgi:predicted dehydrogenase/thiamine biosynthesis lipoprotein ApbE
MATVVEVVAAGPDERALRPAVEEALGEVERLEAQLSRFRPSSEISRINALAGREPVPVEPRLFALLEEARALAALTGGAFDVALGAPWTLDPGARAVRLGAGAALDLGAIGKGYALDRAAAILRERGVRRALLHAGHSTILALGAWPVGLVDPRDGRRRLARLVLEDRALSTSSVHGGRAGGGHVIDPGTGRPAAGAAAWAFAPTGAASDALATAFHVMGCARARRVCARRPELGGAVLDARLRAFGATPRLERESAGPVPLVTRRSFLRSAAAAAAAFAVGLDAGAAPTPRGLEPVTCAVIGAGEQGRLLLAQLTRLKGARVAAVCDPWRPHLQKAIALAGRTVESYADAAHLLDEETDVEAVIVATPTHQHAPVALAALQSGRHVFCEAPLAGSLAEAQAVARTAKETGRVFAVGHQRRASKLHPHALTHIQGGAIGSILQVRAQGHRKTSWRRAVPDAAEERRLNWRLYRETSGGLLLEEGAHALDLAHWWFGAPPVAAAGIGSLAHWKDGREVHDNVQALLEYPEGRQASLSFSLSNSYGGEWELVFGTEGAILLLGQAKGLLFREADAVAAGWEQYAKKEMLGAFRGLVLDADATKYAAHDRPPPVPDGGSADTFYELERFLEAVRGGKPVPCDAAAGMRAVAGAVGAAAAVERRAVHVFDPAQFEV